MSTATKLSLLAQTKEAQRIKLGLAKSVPFSAYVDYMKKVDPKLSANFVTNTYAKSGVASTFADAFTFNRAGKAWLVKDTGLIEYGVDVPRFDAGLLIEREATNVCLGSNAGNTDGSGIATLVANNDFGGLVPEITECSVNPNNVGIVRYSYQFLTEPYAPTLSAYVRTDTGKDIVGFSISSQNDSFFSYNSITGEINHVSSKNKVTVSEYKDWMHLTVECLGVNGYFLHLPYALLTDANDSLYIALRQAEFGEASSYIKTTTAPVTRPADFIQSKVTTGTTITGDWDSTLNLSISNGQIVHTGYGRIRSLEIN